MQPSRNVRWAYGVRISTLPLLYLSYDKNGNWFAVLSAFLSSLQTVKREYIDKNILFKGEIIMMKTKPVYNYDLDQVNALFKRGVFPIGIGVNNKTGNTYVVFKANMRYFDTLKLIEYEQKESQENTNA